MLFRFFSLLSRPNLTAILWDGNLAWRHWSLLTSWTAFKLSVLSPRLDTDLQDLGLALLALSYLSTDPEPQEALALLRLSTLVSVLDTFTRILPASSTHQEDLTRSICSITRVSLVAGMGLSVVRKFLSYQS